MNSVNDNNNDNLFCWICGISKHEDDYGRWCEDCEAAWRTSAHVEIFEALLLKKTRITDNLAWEYHDNWATDRIESLK